MNGIIAILISADGLRRAIRLPERRYDVWTHTAFPMTMGPIEPDFAMHTTITKRHYVLSHARSRLVYEYREVLS